MAKASSTSSQVNTYTVTLQQLLDFFGVTNTEVFQNLEIQGQTATPASATVLLQTAGPIGLQPA